MGVPKSRRTLACYLSGHRSPSIERPYLIGGKRVSSLTTPILPPPGAEHRVSKGNCRDLRWFDVMYLGLVQAWVLDGQGAHIGTPPRRDHGHGCRWLLPAHAIGRGRGSRCPRFYPGGD